MDTIRVVRTVPSTGLAAKPGGPLAQYIRSGPEGAQGALGFAALTLSLSFLLLVFSLSLIL